MIIEAENLKDAYNKAAAELGCSVTQLNVRVLPHPSGGFLGFFKKNAIIEAVDTSTTLTGTKFGAPVRGIKNELTKRYHELEEKSSTLMELEELTLGSLRKAAYEGDVENGSIMSGQIAGLVNEIRPVKDVIEGIFEEAQKVLEETKIEF